MADAFSTLEKRNVRAHLFRCLITPFALALAGFQGDFIEFERFTARLGSQPFRWYIGKPLRRKPGARFVEHHPESVKVRRGRTGAFGGNVPLRSDKRATLAMRADKPNVRQFGATTHKYDVAGLDVAMN